MTYKTEIIRHYLLNRIPSSLLNCSNLEIKVPYLQVESEKAQVVLFLAGRVVGHVLDDHLDRVDVGVDLVLVEEGGQKAEEGERRQHGHCVGLGKKGSLASVAILFNQPAAWHSQPINVAPKGTKQA